MISMESVGDVLYTWNQAEAECQTYGSNVHLAGMETNQVITLKDPADMVRTFIYHTPRLLADSTLSD